MTVTTEKITDAMAGRLGAARHLVDAKVMPYAGPAGRKARKQAAEQASRQMQQARVLVQEKLVPMASSAASNAMVASAPARREAMRRGKLAAAVLRGADAMTVTRKRRRWPVAIGCLAVGSAIGAAVAWLSQAGRPVQLAPYPVLSDPDEPGTVDLTSDEERSQHKM